MRESERRYEKKFRTGPQREGSKDRLKKSVLPTVYRVTSIFVFPITVQPSIYAFPVNQGSIRTPCHTFGDTVKNQARLGVRSPLATWPSRSKPYLQEQRPNHFQTIQPTTLQLFQNICIRPSQGRALEVLPIFPWNRATPKTHAAEASEGFRDREDLLTISPRRRPYIVGSHPLSACCSRW